MRHPLHHPALVITKRRVVSGWGVRTCATHRSGDFLGFYSGRVVSEPEYARMGRDARRRGFGVACTPFVVVHTRRRDDVIGFVNEPPRGRRANAVALPLHLVDGNAVAYFAARAIRAGSEVLVHYGDAFERDYEAGEPANVPSSIQRADAVLSSRSMRQLDRYCARRY